MKSLLPLFTLLLCSLRLAAQTTTSAPLFLLFTQDCMDQLEYRYTYSGTGVLTPGTGALPSGLRMPHYLRDAALRGDWAAWADAWRQLDKGECLRLLGELDSGRQVTLTLCGERAWQTFESAPRSLLQRVSGFFGTRPASMRLEQL